MRIVMKTIGSIGEVLRLHGDLFLQHTPDLVVDGLKKEGRGGAPPLPPLPVFVRVAGESAVGKFQG
jgi:hypothetical protein